MERLRPTPDAAWDAADAAVAVNPAETVASHAPTPAEDLPNIGRIGRYDLKYRIGEGGLGAVYAAWDPLLSRLIAIKTLKLDVDPAAREAFNEMFLNEARAAAGLSHPQIVTVHDAGISDQGAYIAMELLKGRDLRQLREDGWRPTHTQAATIVRRIADALAYAHSRGVVHRDVKPANIFMVARSQPRVLDFGIARVADRHDASHGFGASAGSPFYMAPEQFDHRVVDRRTDVFSLGVVFYELLTGVKPFLGATLEEITRAVLGHEPKAADAIDPDVPPALSAIVVKAIRKNPDDRYRSAREMARDLRRWLEAQSTTEGPEAPRPPDPRPPRRLWVAGAMAVLAGGAFWLVRQVPGGAGPSVATLAVRAVPRPVEAAPQAIAQVSADGRPAVLPAFATSETVAAAASPTAEPVAKPAGHAASGARPDRRARANARQAASAASAPTIPAPLPTGIVQIAVSPWSQVEVDGKPAGVAPPLTQLKLPEGRHTIVFRNDAFPEHSVDVVVDGSRPVVVKHRF